MAKQILNDKESIEKIKAGINLLSDTVGVSLGAKGRTVIIDNYMRPTIVTKDGVTIVKHIELPDQAENTGAAMIRDAALKVLDEVGDGTTTVCVLARAIFMEGIKLISAGFNPILLKKGIEDAVNQVVREIQNMSVEVDDDMLFNVAAVAANNDEEIGILVSQAYEIIGKDGIIDIQEGQSLNTEIKVLDGMRINQGFLDPFYCNDEALSKAEYKDMVVFICDREINTAEELIKILDKYKSKPMLIICGGLEAEAFATARTNRVRIQYPVVAIQAPFVGERRKAVLEDIAILTGATVISEASGLTLDKLKPEYYGYADKITVTQHHTTIVGGHGDKNKITSRATSLKNLADDMETRGFDKQQLKQRAAALSNGIAVMYVGGLSQVEIKEKMDRCDDAIRATKAALEEGIVPGGGWALLCCGEMIEAALSSDKDYSAGMSLITSILSAPLRQMCRNAGLDDGYIVNKCLELDKGYNFNTMQYEDLMVSGIVDPAKVVRTTLQQAASVVGTLLTSAGLIVELPPK
jgi:chaperonin GroEL